MVCARQSEHKLGLITFFLGRGLERGLERNLRTRASDMRCKNAVRTLLVCGVGMIATSVSIAQDTADPEPVVETNEKTTPQPVEAQEPTLLQQLKQAHVRIQEIRRQLSLIQDKTMRKNTQLVEQQGAIQQMVKEKMSAQGFATEGKLEELKALRDQLEGSQTMTAEERERIIQEFREKAMAMQKAQRKAMKDEQISTALDTFEEKLLAAMQKQNPEVDELVEELSATQKRMQELIQKMQQERLQHMQEAEKKKRDAARNEKDENKTSKVPAGAAE